MKSALLILTAVAIVCAWLFYFFKDLDDTEY